MSKKKKRKNNYNIASDYNNNDYNNNNDDFRESVLAAIEDEIAAAAMYATMSNMVKNRVLKALLFNIAGDEYAHARTFLTLYELLDCVKTA